MNEGSPLVERAQRCEVTCPGLPGKGAMNKSRHVSMVAGHPALPRPTMVLSLLLIFPLGSGRTLFKSKFSLSTHHLFHFHCLDGQQCIF